jgi:methyl-accepting chemotaxis protein
MIFFHCFFNYTKALAYLIGKHLQGSMLSYIADANKLAKGNFVVEFDQSSVCWCFNTQAKSLNNAVGCLSSMVQMTIDVSNLIGEEVKDIEKHSKFADDAVAETAKEIDMVASAVVELEASSNNINSNVQSCVDMSKQAFSVSKENEASLKSSSESIGALKVSLDSALVSVESLDEMARSIDNAVERFRLFQSKQTCWYSMLQ